MSSAQIHEMVMVRCRWHLRSRKEAVLIWSSDPTMSDSTCSFLNVSSCISCSISERGEAPYNARVA